MNPDNNLLEVFPTQSTRYRVIGIDQNGCSDTAFVQVDLFPSPTVFATVNSLPNLGDPVQLNANTNPSGGSVVWSPADFLSCTNCQTTFAQPDQNFTYFVEYTDLNGCKATDEVSIIYPPLIYVPNAFTPDGDENNNEFFALGSNINTFQLEIYNRWGELIYTGDALDKAWDGTYAGLKCPDGVYVWKILYSDFVGEQYQIVGHVTLLR